MQEENKIGLENYATLFANLPQVLIIHKVSKTNGDINSKIIDVNNSFLSIFEQKKEDVIGKSIFDFLNKDKDIVNHFEGVLYGAKDFYVIASPRHQIFKLYSFSIGDGLVASVSNQITDARNQDISLFQNDHVMSGILNTMPNILYIFDNKLNRIQYANNVLCDIIGIVSKDVSFIEWDYYSNMIHPDDLDTVNKNIDKFNENNCKGIYEVEYRIKSHDGRWIWLHDRSTPFKTDENGKIIQSIGTAIDITNMKHAEEALKESELRFRSIIRNSSAGYFLIDKDGSIIDANAAWLNMHNFQTLRDLEDANYNFFEEMEADDDKEILITQMMAGRALTNQIIKHSNYGRTSYHTVSINPVYLKGEIIGFEGFAIDITDHKKVEEETKELIVALRISKDLTDERNKEIIALNEKLQDSEKKLTELNASKDKFFSIIAHDLKSPFQGFLGLSNILSNEIDALSKDEIKNLANDMHSSANHLFKLLENLLHWSRIQRGVIEYNPEMFQIKSITQLNINLMLENANQKRITLSNLVEDDLYVYGDPNIVNTILRNLISNAIKFTNYGGNIKVETLVEGDFARVSITDDGIGMSKSVAKKIFRLDTHHSTPGTANESGTGLGLILCKELAEKNKGDIWVKSQIDVGTTFTFTIPLKEK
jgi:PAS domain S-box-containing protein